MSLKDSVSWLLIREKIKERFWLGSDTASQEEVTLNVHKSIEMRGINLWVLIFAIFIASLGLNTNSTAVIIGAMLISPLMGPIIGMGFAAGTYDLDLLKLSFKNFLVMVCVSLFASTLFFLLPLMSFDRSELLARTEPTTYDLLIALFGGLAGMVAQTRKERTGTVIAGVAIATALMPPLCTVGYGIATMQFKYILGALYLFTINSVFIAIASFVVTHMLHYKKQVEMDKAREKALRRMLYFIVLLVTAPSVLIAVHIFQRSLFEDNARNFIKNEFQFEKTVVLDQNVKFRSRKEPSSITVRLIGENLSESVVENLRSQMEKEPYHLRAVRLQVIQTGSDDRLDVSALQLGYSDLLAEKNRQIEILRNELSRIQVADSLDEVAIVRELKAIEPALASASLSGHISYDAAGNPADTLLVCMVECEKAEKQTDTGLIEQWLKVRTGFRKVKLILYKP